MGVWTVGLRFKWINGLWFIYQKKEKKINDDIGRNRGSGGSELYICIVGVCGIIGYSTIYITET